VTFPRRRPTTFRVLGSVFTCTCASVALAALVASCGRVETSPAGPGAGSDGGGATSDTGTSPPVDAAGWVEPPWDALAVDVATPIPPDGGPPPILACATDGGVACPLPPSVCVDDSWLRFYTGGECEAGTCVYGSVEYQCPVSPIKPDCADGGCRITPVIR
jgi:hypothetical protein